MAESEILIDPSPASGDVSTSPSAIPLASLEDATDATRHHQGVALAYKDTAGDGTFVSHTTPVPIGYGQLYVMGSTLAGAAGNLTDTTPNYSQWDQIGGKAVIWSNPGTPTRWEIMGVDVTIEESTTTPATGELELIIVADDVTSITSTNNAAFVSGRIGAVIPLTRSKSGEGFDLWYARNLSIIPFAMSTIGVHDGEEYFSAALRYAGATGFVFSNDESEIDLKVLARRIG